MNMLNNGKKETITNQADNCICKKKKNTKKNLKGKDVRHFYLNVHILCLCVCFSFVKCLWNCCFYCHESRQWEYNWYAFYYMTIEIRDDKNKPYGYCFTTNSKNRSNLCCWPHILQKSRRYSSKSLQSKMLLETPINVYLQWLK